MSIILLLPGLISLSYVLRKRLDLAFLSIYLPCALGLPDYFAFRLPHLPPISAAQAAVTPLGLAALFQYAPKWRFARMDLWVVLYLTSLGISEVTQEVVMNDGIFLTFQSVLTMLFPYIIGRALIEPNLRLPVVKRWVLVVLCLLPFGLYELRFGQSLFSVIAGRFLQLDMPWHVQLRGGRARISMAFSDAELAGIAFAMTFFMNSWIYSRYKKRVRFSSGLGTLWNRLERYRVPHMLLLAMLVLTQSRGPIAATLFGLVIIQVPKFKNVRMAAMLALVLTVLGIGVAYSYLQHNTNAAEANGASGVSEEQASADYRRALLDNYKPVIEQGGWLGWGQGSYPVFPGQKSIDNDFLLVQITQGRLGLYIWLIICVESLWRLMICAWKFKNRDDLVFVFALLAAIITVWITLATVFLGSQLASMVFLIFGWSQSLRDGSSSTGSAPAAARTGKFDFKKVFS